MQRSSWYFCGLVSTPGPRDGAFRNVSPWPPSWAAYDELRLLLRFTDWNTKEPLTTCFCGSVKLHSFSRGFVVRGRREWSPNWVRSAAHSLLNHCRHWVLIPVLLWQWKGRTERSSALQVAGDVHFLSFSLLIQAGVKEEAFALTSYTTSACSELNCSKDFGLCP